MKRKIISPSNLEVTVIPDVNNVIQNTITVIQSQITVMLNKVRTGATLSTSESRQLESYVSSLVRLSKEHRERVAMEQQKVSKMTDEELIGLMEKILGAKENK